MQNCYKRDAQLRELWNPLWSGGAVGAKNRAFAKRGSKQGLRKRKALEVCRTRVNMAMVHVRAEYNELNLGRI